MLNSVGAAGKVFEYLDRKPEVSTDGKLKPDLLKGHVSFHRLNFAYPTNQNKLVVQVRSVATKETSLYDRESWSHRTTVIINVSGLFFGAEARSGDGTGGSIW